MRGAPQKVLITAALPYANGPLHFGHIAGAYLPADCYARFQRLKGRDVLFICGSDEYGVAITLSAEMAGRTPQEHVNINHAINLNFFKQLHLSFDNFSRTTWPGHVPTTQQFFKDLLANGHIEAKVTDQLYSEADHKFLADRYVMGTCPKCGFTEARGDECQRCGASYEATDLIAPRSKVTGAALTLKPTKHWFLRFDHFKEKLSEWISSKKWKANVTEFAKSYIDDLKPRAITRDSSWGIPVPLEEAKGKVLYVWFDAPIGYISATQEWAEKKGSPNAWKDYWCDPATKYVQFIGKDNIPFHAVFFPAMVMGQNQPYKCVDELPANEFYNFEGKQFSKSEGWTIDLETFFKQFSPDQIRYTIAANAPENQDSEFTWKDFQLRCNSELLGKYGNLINRTLTFLQMHCAGVVPALGHLDETDVKFLAAVEKLSRDSAEAYETFRLRRASELMMELAQTGNVYFDHKKPWTLAKDPSKLAAMHTVLRCCLECLKTLALISSPIIPGTAEKVWYLLGYKTDLSTQNWDTVMQEKIHEGIELPKPEILFQKVEDETIQKETEKLKGLTKDKEVTLEANSQISIDDFKRVDLRVGLILSAERVEKSKKLLKLQVDIGTEVRQIVSGIGEHFTDLSALVGKKVIIVANLKPAKLMGIESQGMVLATSNEFGLELPSLEKAKPGDKVS